jgi:nitroreductase
VGVAQGTLRREHPGALREGNPVDTMDFASGRARSDDLGTIFAQIAAMRRSVYGFRDDPVPNRVIANAIKVAVLAPNHHKTRPWRFFVYAGAGRAPLVAAYETAAVRLGRDVRKARQRALDAPAMIIVGCVPATANPKVRVSEEEFATAAAIQNMLLALACDGVSTLLTTGDFAESDEVHELVGLDRTAGRVMAVVNAGYRNPERPLPPRPHADTDACTTWRESA